MKRGSGILFHLSSLPSSYGIGTLGKEAFNFIDFLAKSGQRYWQILPVGPTGFGDSPYQSFSTFAGNPYFIDLDILIGEGLLTQEEVSAVNWGKDACHVDYGTLYRERAELLRKAFYRGRRDDADRVHAFVIENRDWVNDYALYMACKAYFQMKSWEEWSDEALRLRQPKAVERYRNLLEEDIQYHIYIQYLFFRQWESLRSYGKEKGIVFIGDLPIYVPLDSADVWIYPEFFQLDEKRYPLAVGGVPPDCFSETGQLWGTPLYDWDALKKDNYSWWIRRIGACAKLFDVIRIDHFRGFESYWSVPYGETTAVNGKWITGPGIDFIHRIKEQFPYVEFIAEDLGFLTQKVRDLVIASGFPGMKILQFAFESGDCNDYLPHNYNRNSVVYTGTHDNTTIKGWLQGTKEEEIIFASKYLGLNREEGPSWGLIRGGMSSVSDLFIAQMQDYLDLPGSDRMNIPGTAQGNWTWRLGKSRLTDELAEKIGKMTRMYGR